MPMRKLQLKPGVDVQETPLLNAAQISFSTLIRFYSQLVQKRAGWQKMTATPLIGRCCGLHGWGDIRGNPWLAAGTEQRLAVLTANLVLQDITPVVKEDNPTVSFRTTAGSRTVTIEDPLYSPNVGDWIGLPTYVSVGGIVLAGNYRVTAVVDATHYSVVAATAAASTVTGGAVPLYTTTIASASVTVTLANHGFIPGNTFGAAVSTTVGGVVVFGYYPVISVGAGDFVIHVANVASSSTSASENGGKVRLAYYLPSGLAETVTSGSGYGSGTWGSGLYGGGTTGYAYRPMREWSLDNYGQDLIANPSGGAIYRWRPPVVQPSQVISPTAPTMNSTVFVMSQVQMVVALGSEFGGIQQPLLVRWSDAGDFTDWTATATNQAGSYNIPQGSRLVGGLATGLGALLWTDVGLYQMTYQGLPFVFGFRPLATGCGLIGMRSFAVVGSLIMWLSNHGFFLMSMGSGAPEPIECTVWDILVGNWDLDDPGKFVLGANTLANEFELFFPLAETSSYYVADSVEYGSIKYNYIEKVWDYTISRQLQRTAWQPHWVQTGGNIGNPVGADLNSLLQQHEIGFDADGEAMEWSWQTGDFDLAEGEEMTFVDWIIPDFVTLGNPTIQIAPIMKNYPNDTPQVIGPFSVTPSTNFVPPFGARGRQMAIRCSGSDLGTFNRLGAIRIRAAPDGRGL